MSVSSGDSTISVERSVRPCQVGDAISSRRRQSVRASDEGKRQLAKRQQVGAQADPRPCAPRSFLGLACRHRFGDDRGNPPIGRNSDITAVWKSRAKRRTCLSATSTDHQACTLFLVRSHRYMLQQQRSLCGSIDWTGRDGTGIGAVCVNVKSDTSCQLWQVMQHANSSHKSLSSAAAHLLANDVPLETVGKLVSVNGQNLLYTAEKMTNVTIQSDDRQQRCCWYDARRSSCALPPGRLICQ